MSEAILKRKKSDTVNWVGVFNGLTQRIKDEEIYKSTHPIMVKGAYNMLLINDLAYSIFIDLKDKLQKEGLFKFKIKQLWNRMRSEIDEHNHNIWERMGFRNALFSDISDIYSGYIENSVEIFRIAIHTELTKLGVTRNVNSITYTMMLYLILYYSTRMCEVYQEKMAQVIGRGKVDALEYMKLTNMLAQTRNMLDEFNPDLFLLFAENKAIVESYKNVCRQLNKSSYISNAIKEGSKLHEDNDEDWDMIDKMDDKI